MTQQYLALAVIAFCLMALWFLSPTFRGLVAGFAAGNDPDLKIEELPAIFDGEQKFKIKCNPGKKMPGADRSIQAVSDRASIIYHFTKSARGLIETVDISYPGKFGMIFTLVNGRMTCFERIGGMTRDDPELSAEEQDAIDRFMVGLRACS